MELRHEPNPRITNTDTIARMVGFYTRKEAADYASSIGWPKSSARKVTLPFDRVRWVVSDDHLNIILREVNPDSHLGCYTANDPVCPFCKKAVEPQHSKNIDPKSGGICHDYCLRIKADREFVKAFTPNKDGEYA